ncbi:MAG: hypothetical protein ABW221_21480 [Vicinamibacteria bacterium]
MKTASWILLAIVGSLLLLVSFASATLGYRGEYTIGPGQVKVQDVASGRADVLEGLRGIRGTSAAYAAGYAALFLAIVLGPYKRGDVWAWWALLAGVLLVVLISLARIPMLGSRWGIGTAVTPMGIALLGLLLDVKRLAARA